MMIRSMMQILKMSVNQQLFHDNHALNDEQKDIQCAI